MDFIHHFLKSRPEGVSGRCCSKLRIAGDTPGIQYGTGSRVLEPGTGTPSQGNEALGKPTGLTRPQW